MKRRRDADADADADVILISSDDDGLDGSDCDDTDDNDKYISAADDDTADDDDETDDDDDEIDDDETDDDDDDDDDYVFEEDTEEEDEEEDSSPDGRKAPRKASKRAFPEYFGKGDAKSIKARKEKQQQRLKKEGGHVISQTPLSRGDQKYYAEALNIIRGGDMEELKLEHCKAYLRHYSLRQTGSKPTLRDRVQEHIELKAHGGMVKYPRSTFTINCTGDACTGDVVLFHQRVKNDKKANRSLKQPSFLRRTVAGRIVKESYGAAKQQHTFTVEVLWTKGPKALPVLYPLLIKGRKLYRMKTLRQRWADEGERKRVLQEKHSQGDVARKARDDRISGKRPSCSNQRRPSKRKAEVTLKTEQTVKISRKNVNAGVPSSSRGKAGVDYTSKETISREGGVDSSLVLSQRVSENVVCGTSRSTKCVLSMKAGFAGLLIGSKGRNIGAISRASGARVNICEDPLNPGSRRLVEITGAAEEVQVAKGMVIKSFIDKGLPPPVDTTLPSGGVTGQQGWQRHNASNGLVMPNHNIFIPTGNASHGFSIRNHNTVIPTGNASLGGMLAVSTREQELRASYVRDLRNGGRFLGMW